MDNTKFNRETFTLIPRWVDERELEPRLQKLIITQRIGDLRSGSSPKVNGKLALRENPLIMRRSSMYNNTVVPEYWQGGAPNRVRFYYECPRPYSVAGDGGNLRHIVQNKLAVKLANLVREQSINLSIHLGEFYKNLNWFERRLNEAATIMAAIFTRKGRVDLLRKLLTKDQKDYQYFQSVYRKHGTLPRAFHAHPDYYPKRNRHRILKEMQEGISKRDKSLKKELADLELEWSYAVSPILQDCQKLANKIDNYDLNSLPLKIVKGGNVSQVQKFGEGKNAYTVTTDTKVIGRVSGYMTISDARLNTLTQFGFSNWAVTLWDLTTLSFVVDWFYPIGTWLDQFTALNGWDVSKMSTTITTTKFVSVMHSQGAYATGSTYEKIRDLRPPEYKLMIQNPFTSLRRGLNQLSLAVSLSSKR